MTVQHLDPLVHVYYAGQCFKHVN